MNQIRKDVFVNELGLEIPIELKWFEKDDAGNEVKEWMLDEYNLAKMIFYKEATALLDPKTEADEIAKLISIGAHNLLNELS